MILISIHALLAESDSKQGRHYIGCKIFLSTLSLRRATKSVTVGTGILQFLSTLSLRRATTRNIILPHVLLISIHALLAESDIPITDRIVVGFEISIHALLAESDQTALKTGYDPIIFLSTLSLRRATSATTSKETLQWISIHALLAESDQIRQTLHRLQDISIHALLAESDFTSFSLKSNQTDFYPRSPCGERPLWLVLVRRFYHFYPRSPCGERLGTYKISAPLQLKISIHARW